MFKRLLPSLLIGAAAIGIAAPAHAGSSDGTFQVKVLGTAVLPEDISTFELRGRGGITLANDLVESARFTQKMGASEFKVPAVALAHGYQSTIAWIADLVGHIVREAQKTAGSKRAIDCKTFRGLVLIDEIDLYLHPTWQAKLIPALRENFPHVQFIATTHSPVVLATLVPDEIVRLQVDPGTGSVQRVAPHADSGEWGSVRTDADLDAQPDPRAMTGTELYQEYFGVERPTLNEQGEDIRDYTALATNPYRNDYHFAFRVQDGRIAAVREYVDTKYADEMLFANR